MLWHHAATALVAVAIGTAGGWKVRGWVADRQAAEVQAQIATAREEAIHAALIETTRRLDAQQEATRNARTQAQRAKADADAARSALGGLRDAANAAAADSACTDAPSTGRGPADRLAHVLDQMAGEAAAMAEVLDRAIIAGQACEASYNALILENPRVR